MSKIDKYLEEAVHNIREDRERALSLLTDLADYISGAQDRHREVGQTAAKYLETLQRSNEQLVKITALLKKKTAAEDDEEYGDLDKKEAQSLYDEFEGQ